VQIADTLSPRSDRRQLDAMSFDLRCLRTYEFPLTAECAFMNHAGASPLPRRSADALRHYADRHNAPEDIDAPLRGAQARERGSVP